MKNIMLDLETLGNKPGAVIVAIGAVAFGGGQLGPEFYNRIDAESCVRTGLKLDTSTVLWWMKQDDTARAELNQSGVPIREALVNFSQWLTEQKGSLLWGNGSDFDNTILAAAYDACELTTPWKFWHNRCYRTLKNMRPDIRLVNSGTKHNALDDALAQAEHLMLLFPEV